MTAISLSDSGNSGSPVIQTLTGKAIGVTDYVETIHVDYEALRNNRLDQVISKNDRQFFGYRLDSVQRWETLDLSKWQTQIERVTTFRRNNYDLLAVLQGRYDDVNKQSAVHPIIETYFDRKSRPDPNRKMAAEEIAAEEQRDLLTRAKSFADQSGQDFSADSYYDYFRTSPDWGTNIVEQTKFRQGLSQALTNSIDLSRIEQNKSGSTFNEHDRGGSAFNSNPPDQGSTGRTVIRGNTSTNRTGAPATGAPQF